MASQPLFNLALHVRGLELYERYQQMSPEDAARLEYPNDANDPNDDRRP